MALWGKSNEPPPPTIVVLSVGGREDRLPKFCHSIGPGTDVIGRDESCSIQVLDPKISRRQISIYFDQDAGGFVASDLGSANGSYVNGERVTRPTLLAEGDLIEIGNSRLIFTSQRFRDQIAAVAHFKRHGERDRMTLPGETSDPA